MRDKKRNLEGYADPTPYEALYRLDPLKKENLDDAKRMDMALKTTKRIFSVAGFEVIGRITLKNQRTGKIYE